MNFDKEMQDIDKILENLDYLTLMEVRQLIFEIENNLDDYESMLNKKGKFGMFEYIFLIGCFIFVFYGSNSIIVAFFMCCIWAIIIKIICILTSKIDRNSSKDIRRKMQFLLKQLKEREHELSHDRKSDRELARELKRKRTFNELDNESLIYQYSQLQAIQNQSNQQAYLFFQEAQKALRNNQRSSVEDALDKLEKAFGV